MRQASHSQRSKRNATSPTPRSTSRHAGSRLSDPEPLTLRRSTRLINSLPRSDYSISERWSYGADVYETRCDTSHLKGGDAHKSFGHNKRGRTSSHDRKKRKVGTNKSKECVAYCTRSRTTLKPTESVGEGTTSTKPETLTEAQADQNNIATSNQQNHSEGGLLPLDERDYAYSPYSSSTVADLLDSDYSVYSPTAKRRKGKKRKRSVHRSLSLKRSSFLLNAEDTKKKSKHIDTPSKDSLDARDFKTNRNFQQETEREVTEVALATCSYSLRNRHPPTSTVTCEKIDYNTGTISLFIKKILCRFRFQHGQSFRYGI